MDEIIDRMIEILDGEIPEKLSKINNHYSASDQVNSEFNNQALTLFKPVIKHGSDSSFGGMPLIVIHPDSQEPDNIGSSTNDIADDTHSFTIAFHFGADQKQVTMRMLRRYWWAIYRVLREDRFQHLSDSNDENHFSEWCSIGKARFGTMQSSSRTGLVNTVLCSATFKIPTIRIDRVIGFC